MFALPEILLTSAALDRLRNTCYSRIGVISSTADPVQLQQLLVTVFGNVPAVISSSGQRRQFCSLPLAAVLVWARADNLKVHSENCVVLLLSAWVKVYCKARAKALRIRLASQEAELAAEAAAAALYEESEEGSEEASEEEAASEEAESEEADAEEAADEFNSDESSSDDEDDNIKRVLDQLANCVRVLHLSPSYQRHMVLNLPWFRGCTSIKCLPYLQLQKAAGQDAKMQGAWGAYVPPFWLADARAVADPPGSIDWVVKASELQLLASGGRRPWSPSIYMNGAFFRCELRQTTTQPDAVAFRLHLQVEELVHVSGCSSRNCMTAVKATVALLHPAGDEQARKFAGDRVLSSSEPSYGWRMSLAPSSSSSLVASVAESLAPFMFEGSLRIKVGASSCGQPYMSDHNVVRVTSFDFISHASSLNSPFSLPPVCSA